MQRISKIKLSTSATCLIKFAKTKIPSSILGQILAGFEAGASPADQGIRENERAECASSHAESSTKRSSDRGSDGSASHRDRVEQVIPLSTQGLGKPLPYHEIVSVASVWLFFLITTSLVLDLLKSGWLLVICRGAIARKRYGVAVIFVYRTVGTLTVVRDFRDSRWHQPLPAPYHVPYANSKAGEWCVLAQTSFSSLAVLPCPARTDDRRKRINTPACPPRYYRFVRIVEL